MTLAGNTPTYTTNGTRLEGARVLIALGGVGVEREDRLVQWKGFDSRRPTGLGMS